MGEIPKYNPDADKGKKKETEFDVIVGPGGTVTRVEKGKKVETAEDLQKDRHKR